MPQHFDAFTSLALEKATRNVANPEAADALAASLARERVGAIEGPKARAIERWLATTARKAWIKSAPSVPVSAQEAEGLAAAGKPWARAAFTSGSLVKIELEEKRREAMEVIDFLMSAQAPRLARLSFEAALEASKAWHEKMARQKTFEEDPQGIEVYLEMPDGLKWVKVKSAKSLAREGALMSHCVGSYAEQVERQSCEIFSLRDENNRPRLTIEARGLDAAGQDVKAEHASATQWAQIRARANAAPSLEHGVALRALSIKMREDQRPVVQADELISSGLVLKEDTQELALLSELEQGYVIKHRARFARRMPDGIESVAFASSVEIESARLPTSFSVNAKRLTLKQCFGGEAKVENRCEDGLLEIEGIQNFNVFSAHGQEVNVRGQSKKALWRNLLEAGATQTSMVMAALGAGSRPQQVEIFASHGEIVGVLADRLVIKKRESPKDGSQRLVADACVFDQGSFGQNVALSHCVENGKVLPNKLLGKDIAPLPMEMGKAFQNFADPPLTLLCAELTNRARHEKDAGARRRLLGLVSHIGSLGMTWVGSALEENKIFITKGNLIGISVNELAHQKREELNELLSLCLRQPKEAAWIKAIAGELDPGSLPARVEGGDFEGRSFLLSEWATSFEKQFPELAAKARSGTISTQDCDEKPQASRMLEALARSRSRVSGQEAEALWKRAGGKSEGLNFQEGFEDPDLASHGPWRPMASLCWVACPEDGESKISHEVVEEGGALDRAISDIRLTLGDPRQDQVHGFERDSDAMAHARRAELATMALCWPLDDVRLAAPPAPPAEIKQAPALTTTQPLFELACAALGLALAKAAGESKNAEHLAKEWMEHLSKSLGMSLSKEELASIGRLTKNHMDLDEPAQGPGLLERCARARGEIYEQWVSRPDLQNILRQEQSPLWSQTDLSSLAQTLDQMGAGSLAAAAKKAAAEASPQAWSNAFESLNRQELVEKFWTCASLSRQGREQLIEASRKFVEQEWGDNLFGSLGEEGAIKTDIFWMSVGCQGGVAAMMRDALESWRQEAMGRAPAEHFLAMVDLDMLKECESSLSQDEELAKNWSAGRLAALRKSITKARLARPGLPAGKEMVLNDFKTQWPKMLPALIDGASKGLSTHQALEAAYGHGMKPGQWGWSTQQKRKIAREVSQLDPFTSEMREELIDALSRVDHYRSAFAAHSPR